MSDKVFLDIVNMSITGSFAILIIILARLLLKKSSKGFLLRIVVCCLFPSACTRFL